MVLTPSSMVELGTPAPEFRLPDAAGNEHASTDFAGTPLLVMFICNHCPYVKHIADVLGTRTAQWMAAGVAVVGINSNDVENYPEDRPELMQLEAIERGYTFPYLFDETQAVARAFDAQCTPDFFLYDADHRLVYRGQFDDARPGNEAPVTGDDLDAAVTALLAGANVPQQLPSVGCNIKWKA